MVVQNQRRRPFGWRRRNWCSRFGLITARPCKAPSEQKPNCAHDGKDLRLEILNYNRLPANQSRNQGCSTHKRLGCTGGSESLHGVPVVSFWYDDKRLKRGKLSTFVDKSWISLFEIDFFDVTGKIIMTKCKKYVVRHIFVCILIETKS